MGDHSVAGARYAEVADAGYVEQPSQYRRISKIAGLVASSVWI